MSSVVAIIVTAVVLLFGAPIMQLFSNDPGVIRAGQEYLVIVGSFYIVFNAMFTIAGVMRGAGDTLVPMFITLFSLWIIRIPVAMMLSGKVGETGIWWAIPIAWFIGAISSYIYYLTGRWKTKTVVQIRPASH
jgi:Na+-driven multidrug efflux pump